MYKQLTTGAGAESNPVVSPDGQQIAYRRHRQRVFTAPVSRRRADAGRDRRRAGMGRRTAAASIYQPTTRVAQRRRQGQWSPDEDLFPFPVRFLPNGRFLYTADGKLRIRDADGCGLTRRAVHRVAQRATARHHDSEGPQFDNFDRAPVKGISAPALSPDGRASPSSR